MQRTSLRLSFILMFSAFHVLLSFLWFFVITQRKRFLFWKSTTVNCARSSTSLSWNQITSTLVSPALYINTFPQHYKPGFNRTQSYRLITSYVVMTDPGKRTERQRLCPKRRRTSFNFISAHITGSLSHLFVIYTLQRLQRISEISTISFFFCCEVCGQCWWLG